MNINSENVMKILIVEDEFIIANNLRSIVEQLGYEVIGIANTSEKAFGFIAQQQPDLVLMDIYLSGLMNGIELAQLLKEKYQLPHIYITSYADKNTLADAKKTEPWGYIRKPFQKNDIEIALELANYRYAYGQEALLRKEIDRQLQEITHLKKQLEAEKGYLLEEVKNIYNFEEIIGTSATLQDTLIKVGMVAKTDSTVLILGETGTGKELIARAIHHISERNSKPLIKLNCAALPAQLIESELFGHERGAFTGAIDKRIGKFELAHNGTLFLDEIGELPLELQAKLLRVLQEKEIERLGSNKVITTDVRIIAATNRDLLEEAQNGKFRMDLYYRLNVFPITVPPLRKRKEDLPILATHFLQKISKKLGKNKLRFSPAALTLMTHYDWPGNIRELEHVIERSVILCKDNLIHDLNLPAAKIPDASPAILADTVVKTLADFERDYILEILNRCNGKIRGANGAAVLLGLLPTTLESKMQKLGIKRIFGSKN